MKKITLDQDNFKHFFSPVGPLHSHHEEHVWPYDYVDRDSDTLLVTIGDSWTWGSGIQGSDIDAIGATEEQKQLLNREQALSLVLDKSKPLIPPTALDRSPK